MSLKRILHFVDSKTAAATSKAEIIIDQIIDSLIVGGIAGFSAYIASGPDASFKVFGLAFGMTFLIKFKEYRGIK